MSTNAHPVEQSATVVKSTCEKYAVRKKPHAWAEINLDEKTGAVNIISDYGNWGYAWRCIGPTTLKEFLVGCDKYYLMGKFGQGVKVFDGVATAKDLRKYVLEKRRNRDISKDATREAFEALEQCEYEYDRSSDLFWNHLTEFDVFNNGDIWEMGVYTREPQLEGFFDKLWPVFVEHLEGEIKALQETSK